MKTSSTEPGPPSGDGVRPASFDRPLGGRGASAEPRVTAAMDRGRTQGRAEGFALGWAQGRQAAAEREQVEAASRAQRDAAAHRADRVRVEAAVDQLAAAAHRLDRSVAPAWTELADVIADGALAIARAALGRELAGLDQPVLDAVRTALRTLADPPDVVLRLHPADHATVAPLLAAGAGVRLVADPEVEHGDVLALTPVQRLRLSLPAAVAAAEEVLRP